MGSKEKKRSKKTSQGRKKKGDRGSRKKSSKKLRSSLEFDDESLISVSSSSNSSEEDLVNGRRSRSRARKDIKGHKRRARSSSCTSDSRSDSSVRVKKRKNSKRKIGLGRKKKDGKKYKRSSSISSTSSDKSDYEKSRGDSKKKEKRRQYDKEDKTKRKTKRNKAQSISPSSESSASEYERKRKRYRSPSGSSFSISSESDIERKRKRYWSPSGSPMSRDPDVPDEIEVQKNPIRKLNSIIVVASSAKPDQNSMSNALGNDHDMSHDENSMRYKKGENIEEKKSATEGTSLVPGSEDLESILRRKALENLKRFRGAPKAAKKSEKMETSVPGVKELPVTEKAADQENIDGSDMNRSLPSEIQLTQNKSDKGRVRHANLGSFSGNEKALGSPSVSNLSFKKNVETETGGTKFSQCSEDNRDVVRKADSLNLPSVTDISPKTGDNGVSRHNLISQSSKLSGVKFKAQSESASQRPLATCSVKDQKSSPQEYKNSKLVASKCSTDMSSNTQVNEVNDKGIININKESYIVKETVTDSPSSSIPDSTAGELVSSEHKAEDKEPSSQFQEKTMTVMRGGELVQVSYKVYIPKKPPGANRRKLNR